MLHCASLVTKIGACGYVHLRGIPFHGVSGRDDSKLGAFGEDRGIGRVRELAIVGGAAEVAAAGLGQGV
jgi:hypothetical protein